MPHRVPCSALHGCNSSPPTASSSSICSPRISSPVASARLASSTSANNDPSQHNPHRVHSVSVRLGVMWDIMEERAVAREFLNDGSSWYPPLKSSDQHSGHLHQEMAAFARNRP